MGLKLDIDELVVHGVSGTESRRLISMIERELETLLAGAEAIDGRVEGGRLGDVEVEIPANLKVGDLGRRVARTIFECIRGAPVPTTGASTVPMMDFETTDSASPGATGRVE